jgi:hypothetical protein
MENGYTAQKIAAPRATRSLSDLRARKYSGMQVTDEQRLLKLRIAIAEFSVFKPSSLNTPATR